MFLSSTITRKPSDSDGIYVGLLDSAETHLGTAVQRGMPAARIRMQYRHAPSSLRAVKTVGDLLDCCASRCWRRSSPRRSRSPLTAKAPAWPDRTESQCPVPEVIPAPGSASGARTSGPSSTPPKNRSTIRVRTSEVTAPVTVLDHQGEMVMDLAQKDFHVFDNGVEQPIDHWDLGRRCLARFWS